MHREMMANDGHIAKDTLFGPERLAARAIDWDRSDRSLHQGAQPMCCISDAFGAAFETVALAPHYMAATETTPASLEKPMPRGSHPYMVRGQWRGARDVLQFLSHIFVDPVQATAAVGTGFGAGRQFHLHPGDVVRDRATLRLILLLDVRQLHPRRHGSGGDLAGLECQLELLGRLGRAAEPVRPVSRQLMARLSLQSVYWTD